VRARSDALAHLRAVTISDAQRGYGHGFSVLEVIDMVKRRFSRRSCERSTRRSGVDRGTI
jgi:hypothetical protein